MRCPNCGAEGTLVYADVYQVCFEHHINKDGTISKRFKKTEPLSEEWNYISCSNCGLNMVGHDYPTYGIENNKIVFDREDEE